MEFQRIGRRRYRAIQRDAAAVERDRVATPDGIAIGSRKRDRTESESRDVIRVAKSLRRPWKHQVRTDVSGWRAIPGPVGGVRPRRTCGTGAGPGMCGRGHTFFESFQAQLPGAYPNRNRGPAALAPTRLAMREPGAEHGVAPLR